jgi:protein gp37
VTLHPQRLGAPLRWRKPTTVFVNSMSDLFHKDVPDEYIAAVWCSMAWTSWWNRGDVGWRGRAAKPVHTFQVLTKRHARMRSWVSGWGERDQRVAWIEAARDRGWCDHEDVRDAALMPAVLDNVWLGMSVEDQKRAELRIPHLLETPAAVRFLSCEPLLGPVDLGPWTVPDATGTTPCIPDLHWVIAGGESGHGARPMHPAWARQLRDQCAVSGVAFLLKQRGAWTWDQPEGWRGYRDSSRDTFRPDGTRYRPTEPDMLLDPDMITHYRVGKKAAGRLLDGELHDAMPERAR